MTAKLPDLAGILRRAGLRATPQRVAVLAALSESVLHADAETIYTEVRARIGEVSSQTIYNVLRSLVIAGLVRRIEPAGSPGLYELRVGDNHHHIVCRRCGATADIDCAVGAAPCLEPSKTNGFLVDEAEVTFWGTCPACQGEGASNRPGATVIRPEGERQDL